MSNTTTSVESTFSNTDRPDGGGKFAWILWGGAALTLGLAATLPFADRISYKYARFGETLEGLGLGMGVLFLAGLVYVALALVVRAVRASAAVTEYTTERITFLTEELTTQMALVRSGQNQGQSNQEDLRQVLARVGAEVAALGTKEGDSSSDALFRLAASVDQLSARVDERFNLMTERVEDRLDEFSNDLERLERTGSVVSSPPESAAPTGGISVPPSAFEPDPMDVDSVIENPFEAIDLEHQPAMEFLDSMEEQVEGGQHRESQLSIEVDDGPGPFSIEDETNGEDRQSA